ncbi:hypothetical protein GCM10027429_19810 [Marivirga atlantica]|jgi:hypothetical protein|uniref:DUF4168 domain-containing protein n=1 Tax=Marivirga atlantica TaxID=1548457 RepID=A0A937AFL5_9BACT|nr:hypothetical protein [Marivirga atlantica]MBL0765599.1 hypothetical protein [Marivirga atlantica]
MKKMLRNGLIAFIAILGLNVQSAFAQDAEISDNTLYNYALLMQVVEQMKAEISTAVQARIDAQDGFDGKRYSELASAGDNEAKLKELGANEFEIKFMGILVEEQEERKAAIKEVLNTLAQKMVGVANYKAVKSALSSDADVKARYQEIESRIAAPSDDA